MPVSNSPSFSIRVSPPGILSASNQQRLQMPLVPANQGNDRFELRFGAKNRQNVQKKITVINQAKRALTALDAAKKEGGTHTNLAQLESWSKRVNADTIGLLRSKPAEELLKTQFQGLSPEQLEAELAAVHWVGIIPAEEPKTVLQRVAESPLTKGEQTRFPAQLTKMEKLLPQVYDRVYAVGVDEEPGAGSKLDQPGYTPSEMEDRLKALRSTPKTDRKTKDLEWVLESTRRLEKYMSMTRTQEEQTQFFIERARKATSLALGGQPDGGFEFDVTHRTDKPVDDAGAQEFKNAPGKIMGFKVTDN